MNKKGFTMVELIAIIIILSAITLVAFPTINGMIKNSQIGKDKAYIRTILDEATIMYNDYVTKDMQNQIINKNIYSLLDSDKPEHGQLFINQYGSIALSVLVEDRCYIKQYNGDIEYQETNNCSL